MIKSMKLLKSVSMSMGHKFRSWLSYFQIDLSRSVVPNLSFPLNKLINSCDEGIRIVLSDNCHL